MNRNQVIWLSLSGILAVLFGIGWLIFQTNIKHEIDRSSKLTKEELNIVSILIKERLQKRNYQSANDFVKNWGENTPDIVKIRLTADNGFVLSEYFRDQAAQQSIFDFSTIQYSYDSQAKLEITRSLDPVYHERNVFLYQLLSAYIFISSILIYLIRINLRLYDQKKKLTQENQLRIQTEKMLQEREQNLSVTLDSIGDAVITTDESGVVTRMNSVAEQLTGWNFPEAKGLSLKTIFPIVNASTRKSIENPIEKVIATGEVVFLSNHTTLIAKDGTEYQIADSAAPIRNGEKILGMILVFNDVTAQYQLRQAAEKNKRNLQAIMDHSPAVIYVKDLNGKYRFVNQQFENVFSISRNSIIGKGDSEAFAEELTSKLVDRDKNVIETGAIEEINQVFFIGNDPHSFLTRKFPLLNEAEEVYAVCGMANDVTDQLIQEEQLRRSQKMDALGKLTGGIAHDYNNLLGIIQGYAEQLRDHLVHDVKLSKYAHDIQHAAERGAKLTKKLLAFSQHKSGDRSIFDINKLILDQRLMLEKILTARIKLLLDTQNNLWPVNLDIGDLEDAIVNMTINAMHAMDHGGQLTFRTSNETLSSNEAHQLHLPEGDYVLLCVTDTGSGMDDATRERIFDPFYTTKGEKGSGLGLSQVYGFVERSGGAIKVFSELGHGTRFAIYIPKSEQLVGKKQNLLSNSGFSLYGTETILVVDDEHAIVDLAYEILTNQGYRVLTANDGMEALSILEKQHVDLLVSDVIMPKMDGCELATRVRACYPRTKIQLVSGFSDDRHSNLPNDDLHKNMLNKPYSSKTLLTRIRQLLDSENDLNAKKNIIQDRQTILVLDDDENIRELFELNLKKLGYNVIQASKGEEAIEIYRHYINHNKSIDLVISDLALPGGLDGLETAREIHLMDPEAKLIVASGNINAPEMTNYAEYGFVGAMEKDFDRLKMQKLIKEILSHEYNKML